MLSESTSLKQSYKLAAGSGWLFVVLLTLSNVLPGLPPAASSPADQVLRYFLVHRSIFLFAVCLQGLAVWPFLLFAATLGKDLEVQKQDIVPSLLVAFASIAAAAALAVASFWAALAYRAPAGLDPVTIGVLFDLGNVGYNFIGFPFAAFLGIASTRMRAKRWGPGWLAWLGYIAAVGQLVTGAAFASTGAFAPGGWSFVAAFALFSFWIVVVSYVFWRLNS
jgi:hypothetical protein